MRRYLLSLIAVGLWPTLAFAQTGTQVVEYYHHTDALALRHAQGDPERGCLAVRAEGSGRYGR
jgi:hypothetical protein